MAWAQQAVRQAGCRRLRGRPHAETGLATCSTAWPYALPARAGPHDLLDAVVTEMQILPARRDRTSGPWTCFLHAV